MQKLIAVWGVIFVSLTGAAIAAPPVSQSVRDACRADYQQFCSTHAPESEAVQECMAGVFEKLSETCVAAILDSDLVDSAAADLVERPASTDTAATDEPVPVVPAAASAVSLGSQPVPLVTPAVATSTVETSAAPAPALATTPATGWTAELSQPALDEARPAIPRAQRAGAKRKAASAKRRTASLGKGQARASKARHASKRHAAKRYASKRNLSKRYASKGYASKGRSYAAKRSDRRVIAVRGAPSKRVVWESARGERVARHRDRFDSYRYARYDD